MAALTYPSVLLVSNWDKQKGVQSKPSGIGEALKALARLHDGVDYAQLDTAKLKSAAELRERIDAIEAGVKKKLKAAGDQAKLVATLAKKWEAEYKKAAQNPKEASAAAASVAKAAADFAEALLQAAAPVQAELAARAQKLEAEAKKDAGRGSDAETADHKLVRSKLVAALRQVKAAAPEAKPVLFMLGVGKTSCGVFMGPSVGASHKALISKLMDGEAGLKFHQGECIWEQKAYTFVGDDVPSGLAKKLQKGLLELTALRLKVRVRKTSGEVDEVDGDDVPLDLADADADSASIPVAPPAPPEARPAAESASAVLAALIVRHKALAAQLDKLQAFDGPAGAGIKGRVDAATQALKDRDSAGAAKQLDQLEQIAKAIVAKKAAKAAAASATAAAAPPAAPTAVPADGKLVAYRKLLLEWDQAKKKAGAQITQFRDSVVSEYPELGSAARSLDQVMQRFNEGLADALDDILNASSGAQRDRHTERAAVIARRYFAMVLADPLFSHVDQNPLVPLTLRATLGNTLKKLIAALA